MIWSKAGRWDVHCLVQTPAGPFACRRGAALPGEAPGCSLPCPHVLARHGGACRWAPRLSGVTGHWPLVIRTAVVGAWAQASCCAGEEPPAVLGVPTLSSRGGSAGGLALARQRSPQTVATTSLPHGVSRARGSQRAGISSGKAVPAWSTRTAARSVPAESQPHFLFTHQDPPDTVTTGVCRWMVFCNRENVILFFLKLFVPKQGGLLVLLLFNFFPHVVVKRT